MRLSLDKSQKRPENPDRLIDYKSQRETMKTALGVGKSGNDSQLIRWCLDIKTFVMKILLIDKFFIKQRVAERFEVLVRHIYNSTFNGKTSKLYL